jgi:hypothetical protein
MLKGKGVETGGERARGCAAARRTDAKRLGDAARVASACDSQRMQAREEACKLKNDLALTPSRWKCTAEGGTSARRGGTLESSTSIEGQRDERVRLYPFPGERVHMRGCVGAWLRDKVRACAHRGHGHGDGLGHGNNTATGRTSGRTRKEGRPAGCARRRRLRHLHEKISQPASMAGITQHDGATTRW